MHDHLAVAESALPGAFFGKLESLPISVDDKGVPRTSTAKKENPSPSAWSQKRDEFMTFYISQLIDQKPGMR